MHCKINKRIEGLAGPSFHESRGIPQVEVRVDGQRFDDLARLFCASLNRKRFLAIVAGIAAPAALSEDGAAKKHKKRNRSNGGGDVDPQGAVPVVCSGACTKDAECPESPDCMCDLETNRCQTVLCGGVCDDERPCQNLPGCTCVQVAENLSLCETATCGNVCSKGECGDVEDDSCVCDNETNLCVTIACFGTCADNAECAEKCACFFGSDVDVANAAEVEAATLGAEGVPAGACGACIGAGDPCNASTECCGQLVCRGSGEGPSQEGEFAGTCQRKPKPKPDKDRCGKHGQSCRRDNDCCAQAVCFKGKCGEKDSHCHNDSECAQGYSCQGGPLAPGHRRCRKNGRRNRNRRNKNGDKR